MHSQTTVYCRRIITYRLSRIARRYVHPSARQPIYRPRRELVRSCALYLTTTLKLITMAPTDPATLLSNRGQPTAEVASSQMRHRRRGRIADCHMCPSAAASSPRQRFAREATERCVIRLIYVVAFRRNEVVFDAYVVVYRLDRQAMTKKYTRVLQMTYRSLRRIVWQRDLILYTIATFERTKGKVKEDVEARKLHCVTPMWRQWTTRFKCFRTELFDIRIGAICTLTVYKFVL